jgi:hypothetical protein
VQYEPKRAKPNNPAPLRLESVGSCLLVSWTRKKAQASTDACTTENYQGALGEKPIRARFSPAFERGFLLLKEYRDTYDTTLVTAERCQGKFKTVEAFAKKWRTTRARQGKTNQSSATESRIRRLVSLGFLGEKEDELQTPPFERHFLLLKEYKDTYDTTLITAVRCHGNFKTVRRFLRKWRAIRAEQGKCHQSSATESRIHRLVSVGFLGEEEDERQAQASTDACTTEDDHGAPGKKPIKARWSPAFERDFLLLKEYKDTYGATLVTAVHSQGKYKSLNPFLRHMRWVQDKQNKTKQSSATESRIHRLVALGFLRNSEDKDRQMQLLLQKTKEHLESGRRMHLIEISSH